MSLDVASSLWGPRKAGLAGVALALVLAAFVPGCAGPGQSGIYYATGKDAVTPDGLHRVKWEPFRLSFVKPGADLARYDQILLDGVTVSYERTPTDQPTLSPNYALPPDGMAFLKKTFHDEFVRELSKSADFTIASAPGPRVLRIQAQLVDLVMTTAPVGSVPADEMEFAQNYGAVTLLLDGRDSESGEPLVRVGERREIQLSQTFAQDDAVGKAAAWREQTRQWASELRRELDQLHGLPEIPIPQ